MIFMFMKSRFNISKVKEKNFKEIKMPIGPLKLSMKARAPTSEGVLIGKGVVLGMGRGTRFL